MIADSTFTLKIKSPKATVVKALHVIEGEKVTPGQPLIDLHDWEEQLILSQIEQHATENLSKIAEVDGPRIAEKIFNLKKAEYARKFALSCAVQIYKAEVKRYEAGIISIIDIIHPRQDIASRSFQLLQTSLELELIGQNSKDSLSVLKKISDLIDVERAYVQRQIRRLSIKAPQSGRIQLHVEGGTPVKLGHVLCEIVK